MRVRISLAGLLECQERCSNQFWNICFTSAAVAADVRTGDEVLLPSFTFVATANSVIAAGAKPIFVDVNKHDYTIDVSDLKAKITKKTRAIVPVHWTDILQIWTRLPRWPRDNQLVLLRMHANHSGQRIP